MHHLFCKIITIVALAWSCFVNAQTFTNPVLPGGFPDPSICRVGDTFYLVNSSFEYFPGLPIHKSKDLINWELIGHGLSRQAQCVGKINLHDVQDNGGIYAPTLRYHNGVFYIITTTIYKESITNRSSATNFILTATNPEGPWSNPIIIEGAPGIDPDLFFDDDGRVWYTGNHQPRDPSFDGETEIWMQELDPKDFQLIGKRHFLWRGACDGVWAEGPHIYKKEGRYYLLIAEGGTSFNHAVMVAVSDQITGPYTANKRNPIFSSRQLSFDNWVHSTGHGDLVALEDGRWFMVLLGIRGELNRASNMGRETFIVPVEWEWDIYRDERNLWPVIAPKTGRIERINPVIFNNLSKQNKDGFKETFSSTILDKHWNFRRVPHQNTYDLTAKKGHLRLFTHPNIIEDRAKAHFIGIKQTESDFVFETKMEFSPTNNGSESGIVLIQKDDNYVSFSIKKEKEAHYLILKHQDRSLNILNKIRLDTPIKHVYFQVISKNNVLTFKYKSKGRPYKTAAKTKADLILSKGYTGAHLGIYATSNGVNSNDYSDFDYVTYKPLQQ